MLKTDPTFGKTLRRLRKQAGMTQTELAERAGLHATVISRYESNKLHPTEESLLKLAETLEVSEGELNPQLIPVSELQAILEKLNAIEERLKRVQQAVAPAHPQPFITVPIL